jgi:hypothetical protein
VMRYSASGILSESFPPVRNSPAFALLPLKLFSISELIAVEFACRLSDPLLVRPFTVARAPGSRIISLPVPTVTSGADKPVG